MTTATKIYIEPQFVLALLHIAIRIFYQMQSSMFIKHYRDGEKDDN